MLYTMYRDVHHDADSCMSSTMHCFESYVNVLRNNGIRSWNGRDLGSSLTNLCYKLCLICYPIAIVCLVS